MPQKRKISEQSRQLAEIYREIAEFYNEFAKSFGLTIAAFKVLLIIYNEDNCTQSKITHKTLLPKQTVNAIINGYIKRGMIAPLVESGTDKRSKTIKFTENGSKFIEPIMQKVKKIDLRAMESINEDKREELIDIVTLYKNNLKMD